MQTDKSKSVTNYKLKHISEQESIFQYETLYLWSNVVWSSTESCSTIISKHALFAHAEVCDLYVTLMIQHHIV